MMGVLTSAVVLLLSAGCNGVKHDTGPFDSDGDSWRASMDCDDDNAAVNPAAIEVCDGIDNNCDEAIDESSAEDASSWYADSDGDSYGDLADEQAACEQPEGYVADNTDCDDTRADVNPAATEVCDENDSDEDCDGEADDNDAEGADGKVNFYVDSDGDTYGDMHATETLEACDAPEGYVADNADCDDTRDDINPAATEICDGGVDNDCNGTADAEDGLACTVEITSDGSEALPYCTWSTSCTWDTAVQDECAQKLCEASGYGAGTFVSGNDFCASDADVTSGVKVWYWVVDKDVYEERDYIKESVITAACE